MLFRSNGSGMLPQANSSARPSDLNEIAIDVIDQNDGSFNSGDYILFYGSGPDLIAYDSLIKAFNYKNHLFRSEERRVRKEWKTWWWSKDIDKSKIRCECV